MEPIKPYDLDEIDAMRAAPTWGDIETKRWISTFDAMFNRLEDAARQRAEYDAREARLARAEQERDDLRRGWDVERLNHMGDLHYIAKATGYPYATTEAQPERAIEIVGAVVAIIAARDAATARAEKAEARLARAEALLREAVRYVTPRDTSGDGGHAADLAARIEAHLDAPTPDDRRGEDGAWCEGGRG